MKHNIDISNMVYYSRDGILSSECFSSSKELRKALDLALKTVDLTKLPTEFFLDDIAKKAEENNFTLTHKIRENSHSFTSGMQNGGHEYNIMSKNDENKKSRLFIHCFDVEKNRKVEIDWCIVFELGTKKMSLLPKILRSHSISSQHFLQMLGIIESIPELPELPSEVACGKDVPFLCSCKKELKMVFLMTEIKEQLQEYIDIVNNLVKSA